MPEKAGTIRKKTTGLSYLSKLRAGIFIAALALSARGANAQNFDAARSLNAIQNNIQSQLPSPGVLPTDATKPPINEDRALIDPGWRLRLRQALPARLWFTSVTEVSNRLDTNVFLQYKQPQPDYVFRVQPNLTVGYNIFDKTSIYTNYFVIKDCYTVHPRILNFPTTQSVSMGLRHQLYTGKKLSVQLDCQARELFQNKGLRQADLLPSISTTYFLSPSKILFASTVLQMRSGQLFQGPTRELDPFYTVGYVARKGAWTFSFTDTLVTNFREPHFKFSRPHHGNCSMIADIEISRPVMRKYPGLQAFVRAEPVFNWRSAKVPGLSGFDFRLYGGLRLAVSKPSYIGTIHKIEEKLKKQEEELKRQNQLQNQMQQNQMQSPSSPGTSDSPGSPAAPGASTAPDSQGTPGAPEATSTLPSPASPGVASGSSEAPKISAPGLLLPQAPTAQEANST